MKKGRKPNAIVLFCQEHPRSCIGWSLFLLAALSFYWLFFLSASPLPNKPDHPLNIWIAAIGFMCEIAFSLPSLYLLTVFPYDSKWSFYIVATWLGYLTALMWCWYFTIPFIVPVIAICLVFASYKRFKFSAQFKRRYIWGTISVYLTLGIVAFCFAYQNKKEYIQEQADIQKALSTPAIKVIDVNDGYIFTKEYGLEKIYAVSPIKKGDDIHRQPRQDDKPLVIKKP